MRPTRGDVVDGGWAAGGSDELADPARLHLLDETELIEASAAARLPTLDRVARLAARAMRAPVGQVNLVTADAQVPAAAYVDPHCTGPTGEPMDAADADVGGAWRRPVGLDESYCQHVVRRGTALVVDDATAHPLVRDSRATREGGIRSYASAPVVTPSGVVLGTVCVVDFHPRAWSDDDLAALAECAALAGEEVAARLGAAAALRESEERLRLAMQAAQLGSWSVELRTQEVAASPRCRALHGHVGEGEFGVRDLWLALHPDDRERMREVARLALLEGRDFADEYRVVPAGGGVRWLAVFGRPLRDAAGTVRRVVGLVQDVTERRLAAEERERLLEAERAARAEAEEARRAAEQANRAKSEFLATMSHELRTPLNAIAGYAELMAMELRGPVTPRQREDLARIQRSQRHLLGLINEILDFAKLETGTVHYAIVPVPVRGVLAEAEALVAPLVKGKTLTLSVAACTDAVVVRADAEKLRQVLVNLLSNAVKFTPAGGEITIGCEVVGDRALIAVRDTGIGIAADKLEEIFEPFVQVRADLARTAEGTGLGLAISRDLARGMGGELTAESTPGAGSAFTLALPLA